MIPVTGMIQDIGRAVPHLKEDVDRLVIHRKREIDREAHRRKEGTDPMTSTGVIPQKKEIGTEEDVAEVEATARKLNAIRKILVNGSTICTLMIQRQEAGTD